MMLHFKTMKDWDHRTWVIREYRSAWGWGWEKVHCLGWR